MMNAPAGYRYCMVWKIYGHEYEEYYPTEESMYNSAMIWIDGDEDYVNYFFDDQESLLGGRNSAYFILLKC